MDCTPKISIVIVNFNTSDCLQKCLESIRINIIGFKYEIIVVDNSSVDNSVEMVKNRYQEVILIANKTNIGFGAAANKGISIAKGTYVLILNPDNIFLNNCLLNLIKTMDENHYIGIIGCKTMKNDLNNMELNISAYKYPSYYGELLGAIPFLNKYVNKLGWGRSYKPEKFSNSNIIDVDWVGGSFLFVRKTSFEKIGGFDENYFMYYEEIDLCFRARKSGWRICYVPTELIFHKGQTSSKKFREDCDLYCAESQLYYISKHFGLIKSLFFTAIICLLLPFKMLFWSFQVMIPIISFRAKKKFLNHLFLFKSILKLKHFKSIIYCKNRVISDCEE